MLSFANPFGFLALLGIPVVLAIHFLQRRSRVEVVSTLFLLDSLARESASGGRVERMRNSLPLWLQLLMVVLAAWLLAGPRWTARESVARVVLVLDGSASMSVFKDAMRAQLSGRLKEFERTAGRSEYIVLDSALSEERVFHGEERDQMLARLKEWQPTLGEHDIEPSLRLALGLAGEDGVVAFVSDHLREDLPDGVRLLAVGTPTVNCGFTGLEVVEENGQLLWRALVRNYSGDEQQRQWWLETATGKTEPRAMTLAGNVSEVLQGPMPEGEELATLVIEADAFTIDDRLPLVRPMQKELIVRRPLEGSSLSFYERAFGRFPALKILQAAPEPDEQVDLHVELYDSLGGPEGNAFLMLSDPEAGQAPVETGAIAVENHPLMDGLNWQGLLVRGASKVARRNEDQVLLWAGERALVILRERGDTRQLLLNFDPIQSNATRLPAFVVVIHRFLESLRERKVGLEARNVETGQALEFAFQRGEQAAPLTVRYTRDGKTAATEVSHAEAKLIAAPTRPGHFEIRQGEQTLLRSAAYFADAREADLSGATTVDELSDARAALIEERSQRDPLWRLWVLLITAAVLVSWWLIAGPDGRRRSGSAVAC